MRVLLVEPKYYSQYPPLGLLKISAFHKSLKDTTQLVRGLQKVDKPDVVYITSLFTWAWKPVHEAVRFYKGLFPDVEVWLGGLYVSLLPEHAALSGADRIYGGIFRKAEDLMPDYDLVPEWDGSMIFASRGCVNSCGFCAVPKLEGPLNSIKHSIKHLVWPKHSRIIFFDNNILASPSWRTVFDELEEMGLKVDFNQGLDPALITDEVADRLSKLKIHLIRLGYDIKSEGSIVKKAIERLNAAGIHGRRILVYALYNYVDDPESFFERVREILMWGAVCYPMRFEPLDGLEKNRHIASKWDAQRLEMVQKARRVLGCRGAFPPYEGLVKKFENARYFDQAFGLRPRKSEH
jgi:hypothetical protein